MADDELLSALVGAALEGDDRAVAELVASTHQLVAATCRALASPQEVDDLVQEVFERALVALPGFRAESTVRTWLVRIARNTCADAVRRNRRRRTLTTRAQAERPAPLAIDATTDLAWRQLIDALDADRREAFVLTQLLGLGYAEAAEVLDCPIGTIRSRVARARAELVDGARRARSA